MKIYYDFQILRVQKYGGISRYFYELYNHINDKELAQVKVGCLFNRNRYFEDICGIKEGTNSYRKYKLECTYSLANSFFSDIVHPTYYEPYILKRKRGKLVITVYDMIHEIYPGYFHTEDTTREKKKQLIYHADGIIAISENTKADILKFYPDVKEEKIKVIYLGNSLMTNPTNKANLNRDFPAKYILYVGTRGGYKNFATFFEAAKNILSEDSSMHLLCAGGGNFSDREKEMMNSISDRVHQIDVTDEILAYLYKNAECFVFPSLYEGFGIPTLEAFASGCPCIISNTSSMCEVGGDAAVYIDPYDVSDMKNKISSVIYSEEKKEELRTKGMEREKLFSWDKTAKETVDFYKEILGK